MRGVIATKTRLEKSNKVFSQVNFKKYFLLPFIKGLIGYTGFFVILIISKYLGYYAGTVQIVKIDGADFLLSLIGFTFIFIVKLTEGIKGSH